MPESWRLSSCCQIYTDWANHYLAKSGCPRLIKDLTQDIADGVLLAEIIQIIADEKVEDINGCPRSQSQMRCLFLGPASVCWRVHLADSGARSTKIENVDVCLSFLEARGVNVQGLSSEEIWSGNLKTILGLFFILSRYKQQQQQQQQYYQSLLELQQQVTHQATGAAPGSHHKTQDMQSSLTARYATTTTATATGHSSVGLAQKKNTRLPGPSRVSAAGSGSSKPQGGASLNRRSQSFTSTDKSRPLQYTGANEREMVKGVSQPGGINGSVPPPGSALGQTPPSSIPSPSGGKSLRGKPVSMKHSATSSALSAKSSSPATSPTPPPAPCPSDRLKPPQADPPKAQGQRSMLEKFRFINTRGNARPQPSSSGAELREEEEDEVDEEEYGSEYGEEGPLTGQRQTAKGAAKCVASKALPQGKDKEDRGKGKGKDGVSAREDRDPASEASKKGSRIASLIPKGGKPPGTKKEGSSGIPKPGGKGSVSSSTSTGKLAGSGPPAGDHKAKTGKGGPAFCSQRSQGPPEGRRTSMVSSTSASAISGSSVMSGGVLGPNGVVLLPQQQHSHPNTATVAPYMYRTCSENDCTTVAPGNACLSPTKADLVYSKTAKQCLEEISVAPLLEEKRQESSAGGRLDFSQRGCWPCVNISRRITPALPTARRRGEGEERERGQRPQHEPSPLSLSHRSSGDSQGAAALSHGPYLRRFGVEGGSPSRRTTPPAPALNLNLRKQKSLTNLALQGEAESRASVQEPRWGGHKMAAGAREGGGPAEREREPRVRSLSLSLSRALSLSEQSLSPRGTGARPGTWRQGGETGREEGGRPSFDAPRAPPARARRWAKEPEEEEEEDGGCGREGAAHLDQEVILTMLGDLQQALYSHPVREDPEARRMRTVRNIADLRQNLEETMSSLRGTQVSHSTLETTFDTTVTTEVNGRALSGLASRSSPMSWRLGQSPSPRLQAGDAPSLPGGFPQPRGGSGGAGGASGGGPPGRYAHPDPSRLVYNAPLRRGAAGTGQRGAELGEKGGAEGGPEVEAGGYMSEGDILGKNARPDDVGSGYLTDGGLNLYSRNVGRVPEMAASRDVIQRGVNEMQGGADSWDDSSSVSSGLSDTLDNISTDDLNTPYYSGVSAPPRKSKHSQPKSDVPERHSPDHDISSWDGAEDLKKLDDGSDGVMDPGAKWRPSSSSSPSSSSAGQYEDPDRTGQRGGLPLSHTGSWRRGMTAQVGISPPRTKGAVGTLKNPGKPEDPKVQEKERASAKSSGIQRSPSDAGKSSGDEGKKPPSGIGRPTATIASFGFKKAPGPVGALIPGPRPPRWGGRAGPEGEAAGRPAWTWTARSRRTTRRC
ncbi:hypothetical protein COCON_G00118850 [Conger conger]|uniref:Calponin-homology (CH) domain-containing protein n=1 Tax=Conger conger TaxID=82655 RepID=A0A9Q1DGC7_CONCO|nr:hypothetical protein COCON_G00118850 [Conger conger]